MYAPTMSSQLASHGRGGAGNMAKATGSPKLTPADLETPTLKKPVVTTGRGGTGNMAKNKDPIETRLRQDVEGATKKYSPPPCFLFVPIARDFASPAWGSKDALSQRTPLSNPVANSASSSVPRRSSTGAQHAGRGGAGNVFKGEDAELVQKAATESAVDDSSDSTTTVPKNKGWFFGKKA
ncbi:hypothetical protein HJFPF1_01398 [Paramyrothecium foliicola]|nr:hypothetical protein HJFPF1_01398 [Paramyrothecium foliicola]